MLDKLKELFKKEQIDFDMYNNSNNDDCKSKYNNLIYFIAMYSSELKRGSYTRQEKKHYSNILKHNKEAILMYLNLAIDILSNQSINKDVLENTDLNFVKDLNGNLDLSTLKGKEKFLNQIRNAFAHKSGKINFYVEDGVKKVRIDNQNWFSIEANLDDLNNLLSKIIVRDPENEIQGVMLDAVKNVENNNYQGISDNAIIIILMNLLMCYNKESLFDKFMEAQSSFIDASNFEIDSTSNWNITEQKLRQRFFDKFNILFHTKTDKDSYESEWKSIVDIDSSAQTAQSTYIYDTTKMPFDTHTSRHIPIPLFMNFLRNANSHGRIKIEGNNFIFYDKGNSATSEPYFYMKISKNDLLKFIFNDYFIESITTTIDDHENKYSSNFYLLEQAESVNNFSNYVNIYRNRLSNLSEAEVIKYMYDNNKFSSYLMEYPEQIDSFLEYRLKSGQKLTTFLCQLEKMPANKLDNIDVNSKEYIKQKNGLARDGIDLYLRYLEDSIFSLESGDKTDLREKDYDFFKHYYLFMQNLRNIGPNISLDDIDNLDDETRKKIEMGIKELQYEFIDNDVFMDDSEASIRMQFETGMQKSGLNEIDRIAFAISLGKQNELEKTGEKEKRYTIRNIEKHSSLARIFERSALKNYGFVSEDMKSLAKVLAVNLGVHAFNAGTLLLFSKNGLTPLEAEMQLITYSSSVFISNIKIYSSLFELRDKIKTLYNYRSRIKKYSDNFDGGIEDETRLIGSHNIR